MHSSCLISLENILADAEEKAIDKNGILSLKNR
jgi:hypothetical protein